MGGGTFFKVGGAQVYVKKYRTFFVISIDNCDVTNIEI